MKICYASSAVGIHNQRFFDKFREKGWQVHVVVLDRSRAEGMTGITFHYLLSGVSNYLLTRFPKTAKYLVYPMEGVKYYIFLKNLLSEREQRHEVY